MPTRYSSQEGWHNALRPYIEFIRDLPKNQAQVKIALLDNGVKYKENGITVARGESYYGNQSKNVDFLDFFAGPSGHGTKMASFITDVCPVADLYVCRMDDSLQDKFTVDSAIKVSMPVYIMVLCAYLNSYSLVKGRPMGEGYGGGYYLHELDVQNRGCGPWTAQSLS